MSFLDNLFDGTVASQLATTAEPVSVGESAPPTAGQVLVATDSGHAVWSEAPGGAATDLANQDGVVSISGSGAPEVGDVLTATSPTTAEWLPPTATVDTRVSIDVNCATLEEIEDVYTVTDGPAPGQKILTATTPGAVFNTGDHTPGLGDTVLVLFEPDTEINGVYELTQDIGWVLTMRHNPYMDAANPNAATFRVLTGTRMSGLEFMYEAEFIVHKPSPLIPGPLFGTEETRIVPGKIYQCEGDSILQLLQPGSPVWTYSTFAIQQYSDTYVSINTDGSAQLQQEDGSFATDIATIAVPGGVNYHEWFFDGTDWVLKGLIPTSGTGGGGSLTMMVDGAEFPGVTNLHLVAGANMMLTTETDGDPTQLRVQFDSSANEGVILPLAATVFTDLGYFEQTNIRYAGLHQFLAIADVSSFNLITFNGGREWFEANLPEGVVHDAASSDETIVVVGEGGYIASAPAIDMGPHDATYTWTSRAAAGGYSGAFRRVVWTGTVFIAIGDNRTMQSSVDGITWTSIFDNAGPPGLDATGTVTFEAITVLDGRVAIAVFATSGNDQFSLWISDDQGVTWTKQYDDDTAAFDMYGLWSGTLATGTKAMVTFYYSDGGYRYLISADAGVSWTAKTDSALHVSEAPFRALIQDGVLITQDSISIEYTHDLETWHIAGSPFPIPDLQTSCGYTMTVNLVLVDGNYEPHLFRSMPTVPGIGVSGGGGGEGTITGVVAGSGLQGGGSAGNVTLSTIFGTGVGTVAQGNDTRIVNAVQSSRAVSAGTGLTGGGSLAADRTLAINYSGNVLGLTPGGATSNGSSAGPAHADHTHALPPYGSTAGTICQGDDPRLGGGAPLAHGVTHQDGGTDEISIQNLSGRAADPQTADKLANSGAGVLIGSAVPSTGQVLTATSSTTAVWAAASGGGGGSGDVVGPASSTAGLVASYSGSSGKILANNAAPNIGTPTGTLTNCTGLPVSTGISGLGTNIATFLETPSSANLAAAVTGETGSGALVFGTSPVLTTPSLGTPTTLVLTNATGRASTPQTADTLKTSGTGVVLAATPPTAGQTLVASSGTAASWQTPAGGGVSFGSASSSTVGGPNVDGVATTASRSDHKHALPAFGTASGTFMQGSQAAGGDASGTLNNLNVTQARGLKTSTGVVNVSTATAPLAGQVLTAQGATQAIWADAPGAGAGAGMTVTRITAGVSPGIVGTIYLADATANTVNVVLPAAAASSGKQITLKRIAGSNPVTLAPSGAETIDGAGFSTPLSLAFPFEWASVVCDGIGWFQVS